MMRTAKNLYQRLEKLGATRSHRFPFTYATIVDASFPEDGDEREISVAAQLDLPVADLRSACNRLFLRLVLLRPDEASDSNSSDERFWNRALQMGPETVGSATFPTLHFYGYKGGQGRSTCLALLARALANDGWRVLVADLDVEAPALDVLFALPHAEPEASLVGLRAGATPRPVRVSPSTGEGLIDVVPFRPGGSDWDLDAAALSTELSVFPRGHGLLVAGIRTLMAGESGALPYDVLLVDHRTGLAPSVLPWMHALPGPVAAFCRLDGQWRHALAPLKAIWATDQERDGLLVTPMPPGLDRAAFLDQADAEASTLLAALAEASLPSDESASSDDVRDRWLPLPFDDVLTRPPAPDPADLSAPLRDMLSALRRLTRLGASKRPTRIHPSGGADEGDLIQTLALRELETARTPIRFVLGRKGTGKTRLVRTLVEKGFGVPLLVPGDFQPAESGLAAEDPTLGQVIHDTEPPLLWWKLLAALAKVPKGSREILRAELLALHESGQDPIEAARAAILGLPNPIRVLIDGLETAFPREKTFVFLAELFRFTAGIEADPQLRDRCIVQVFIRNDLAQRGFENFEQQSFGRKLDLKWDVRAILNFVLSRINVLPWFGSHFPGVQKQIRSHLPSIKQGDLPIAQAESLLLEIFPERLGRKNMLTTSFLRTWFSDDPNAETSFYPRIYDDFLRCIGGERPSFAESEIVDGRVSEPLILYAHGLATDGFLQQVRSELLNIVSLNSEQLDRLFEAMKDTSSPFNVEQRSAELASRASLESTQVRDSLSRMKTLGLFEDRPRYEGEWRAGRLFKSALRMKDRGAKGSRAPA